MCDRCFGPEGQKVFDRTLTMSHARMYAQARITENKCQSVKVFAYKKGSGHLMTGANS